MSYQQRFNGVDGKTNPWVISRHLRHKFEATRMTNETEKQENGTEQGGLIDPVVMPKWVDGVPSAQGSYWLRLAPTPLAGGRMQKHTLTCYSYRCGCHGEWVNMDERNRRLIDGELYVVTGYIKLPEA